MVLGFILGALGLWLFVSGYELEAIIPLLLGGGLGLYAMLGRWWMNQ